MGFFATDCQYERREKMHAPPAKPSGEDGPPSENRVWVFSDTSRNRARRSASQVLEPQQENRPTPTATASGVLLYGYRYYNPELGRWVNRDPIEEEGGLNVYGFVRNGSLLYVDVLGKSVFASDAGDASGGRYIEFVIDEISGMVDMVVKAGSMPDAARTAAKNAMSSALSYGKTTIEMSSATSGGMTQFPRGLADGMGRHLTNVGDTYRVPLANFASIGIDTAMWLYSYVTWVDGGAMRLLLDYERAFRIFVNDKSCENCISTCFAGSAFIRGVPSMGTDIAAGFFARYCVGECVRNY